ncbi:MAG: zf-HC2 domain-containing protein, partial [Eubacterium sp.]|nr:zf-HC2 domain-containing protein [Eubacterium sp.]
MSKLDCNIVQDLLPSFADSLVNEKTAAEIKAHLSDCENCTKLYNEMINGEAFEQKEAEKEIDYLKKIKKKTKRIIVSILSALMIMIIIAIGLYSFIGIADKAYSVSDIRITDNLLSAEINLFSSSNSITKVSAKESDGIVTISV